MNRIILLVILWGLAFSYGYSRRITGRVVDVDKEPLEFANVTVFVGGNAVGGSVTDQAGLFCIEISDECESIRVSYVGYEDTVMALKQDDSKSIELGDLTLVESPIMLKEVVVKAPLITREADRIVMNISANPFAANKNTHELLKTAPGVWATDESLSIYGQSGVTVYIDDRKVNMSGAQLMNYLKSIQSSSISTIEILPQTGTEYDADSSGGVIRINLKRSRIDGTNGAAGINITGGEYKQWFNPFVSVGVHSGKLTLNFNGSLNGSPSDRHTSYLESEILPESMSMSGISRYKSRTIQGNAMIGIFYDADETDRLGLQLDYAPERSKSVTDSRTLSHGPVHSEMTTGKYNDTECLHNFNATFNWTHALDDRGSSFKLMSNYNHRYSSVRENNEMSWSDNLRDSIYDTDNNNRYDIFVAEASLRKVFNPEWKINVGSKYTLNSVTDKAYHYFRKDDLQISNPAYDYDSPYHENIVAVYLSADGSFGRWRLKAGIRGEYSGTSGKSVRNGEFDIFPNVNIAYDLTERGDYNISLGYNRSIRRPSFMSLNPVVRQTADYSYAVGNPDLIPSFNNRVSLDLLLGGRFTVALGYSMTQNPIRQMFVANPDYPERMYLTWGNEGKDKSIFIHGDGNMNLTEWWNLYGSATYIVVSQKLQYNSEYDTFGYVQLVAATTFRLPKGFDLSMNIFYNSKMKIGNISINPIFNLNPTVRKSFGSHWVMSRGVEDMLQLKSRIKTSSSTQARTICTKTYTAAKIGVTYNFSSGKRFGAPRIEKILDNSRLSQD